MRFSAGAAIIAGALTANAQVIVTVSNIRTVTSCAPGVDCSLTQTAPVVSATSQPASSSASTTSYEDSYSAAPSASSGDDYNVSSNLGNSSTWSSALSQPTECGVSVRTITSSITTVVPTIIYETMTLSCSTGSGSSSHASSLPVTDSNPPTATDSQPSTATDFYPSATDSNSSTATDFYPSATDSTATGPTLSTVTSATTLTGTATTTNRHTITAPIGTNPVFGTNPATGTGGFYPTSTPIFVGGAAPKGAPVAAVAAFGLFALLV